MSDTEKQVKVIPEEEPNPKLSEQTGAAEKERQEEKVKPDKLPEKTGEKEPGEKKEEELVGEKKTDEPKSEKPGIPDGVQRRIDKITRQLRMAEREIHDMREKTLPEEQRGKGESEYKDRVNEIEWASKLEQAHEDYKDYDDIVNKKEIKVPAYVNEAIMSSDMGADIVYYLSKNTREVENLKGLDPQELHRAIGRLEVRIDIMKKVNAEKEKPAVKSTNAPPPIKPVAQSGTAAQTDIMDPKTPIEEFIKKRNKERWAKGQI